PVTSLGPLLVTVIRYVTVVPGVERGITRVSALVLWITRSDTGVIVSVSVAETGPPGGVTVAVFTIVPLVAATAAPTVKMTVLCGGSVTVVPILPVPLAAPQAALLVPAHVHATPESSAGMVSVNGAFVMVFVGLLLRTTIV